MQRELSSLVLVLALVSCATQKTIDELVAAERYISNLKVQLVAVDSKLAAMEGEGTPETAMAREMLALERQRLTTEIDRSVSELSQLEKKADNERVNAWRQGSATVIEILGLIAATILTATGVGVVGVKLVPQLTSKLAAIVRDKEGVK